MKLSLLPGICLTPRFGLRMQKPAEGFLPVKRRLSPGLEGPGTKGQAM